MNYYLQKFLAFKSNDETKLNGEIIDAIEELRVAIENLESEIADLWDEYEHASDDDDNNNNNNEM